LPPEIGNLPNLDEFYLHFNQSLAGPLPRTLMQLDLTWFWFNDTQLCEPPDAEFQAWLDSVFDLVRTGVLCGSPPPPGSSSTLHLSLFSSEVAAGSVTLQWETEAEADNTGFNLYRVAVDGTATKINSSLIVAQGDADRGASYQFEDRPGKGEYTYLIKNVDQQGSEHLRGQLEVAAEGFAIFMPALAAP
jgi:hypothetical protein